MINDNEHESENGTYKLSTHHTLKMCLSIIMNICIKQHLSNIWSSLKQHWGWVEKNRGLVKSVYLNCYNYMYNCEVKNLFYF